MNNKLPVSDDALGFLELIRQLKHDFGDSPLGREELRRLVALAASLDPDFALALAQFFDVPA